VRTLGRITRAITGRAAWLLAGAALAACGGGEPRPRDLVRGDAVLQSLLTMSEAREVVRAPADAPVVDDLLRPRGSGDESAGQLPSLIVVPPTTVRYALPATHPAAELALELAVHAGGFRGSGKVRFSATLDGRALFERELDCSARVPAEERVWHALRVPLPGGGKLELSADYEGDQPQAPKVGFGRPRVVVPFAVTRSRSSVERPNVVLVVVDTLRADRLSCYGHAAPTSPRLDALAARGTRFERAFASAPWTIPGTASVLTGLSPPEHGLGTSRSYYLVDAVETLAEAFQRAGFTTAAFAGNPLIAPARGFDQGFEHFVVYRWARALHITPDVAAWLREQGERRFFLYVHHVDPHAPYEPTDASRARFVPAPPPGVAEVDPRGTIASWYEDQGTDRERVLASVAHQSNLYDAEVHDVDAQIGALLDELEALGLADRTLVCVTSDHGEEFAEHGWAGHHEQLFDESVRVPLIFAGPGVPPGRVIAAAVENRFTAPTLLALASVAPRGGAAGPNLLSAEELALAAGPGVYVLNSLGTWADFDARTVRKLGPNQSVIVDGWRLVQCPAPPEGEPLYALYDLAADPACRHDVAAQHPERVADLSARIKAWIKAGKERQPTLAPTSAATEEMLRELGYIGDD